MSNDPPAADAALSASARERRLWWLTVAAVVGIYATLGLAPSVADQLRTTGVLEALFGLGAFLVLATVVVVAVRARPTTGEVALWLGLGAVYLLVFVRLAIPEERTHLVEYGVVALVVHEALTERERRGRGRVSPGVAAVALTGLVGVLDEAIQSVLPNRVFDLRDIGFNLLAAGLAVTAVRATRWARRRSPRHRGASERPS